MSFRACLQVAVVAAKARRRARRRWAATVHLLFLPTAMVAAEKRPTAVAATTAEEGGAVHLWILESAAGEKDPAAGSSCHRAASTAATCNHREAVSRRLARDMNALWSCARAQYYAVCTSSFTCSCQSISSRSECAASRSATSSVAGGSSATLNATSRSATRPCALNAA